MSFNMSACPPVPLPPPTDNGIPDEREGGGGVGEEGEVAGRGGTERSEEHGGGITHIFFFLSFFYLFINSIFLSFTFAVNKLHPGHIKVVMAMGDSITAAMSAKDTSIFNMKEYPFLPFPFLFLPFPCLPSPTLHSLFATIPALASFPPFYLVATVSDIEDWLIQLERMQVSSFLFFLLSFSLSFLLNLLPFLFF